MVDYSFNLGNLITIIAGVIGFISGYATLQQKVKELKDKVRCHDSKLDTIESKHSESMEALWSELRSISAILNQIVGRLDSQSK